MDSATLNGIELDYDVQGSGEPVLLISTGPIADSFLPFLSEPVLIDRYRLITYRQRGQSGRAEIGPAVSFAEHAADAAALLEGLGIRRAHIAGHSTGGDIALQLAVQRPDLVHTLSLLEPALTGVPSAADFFARVAPAVAVYESGKREEAMAMFLGVVCSLDWETCRKVINEHVPGGIAEAMKNADTFFRSYLPALSAWSFGQADAAAIPQPVLSVLGTATERLFVEGRDLLHSWFPQVEDLTVDGVAHLLHIQRPEPVARGVAAFLGRHPMTSTERRTTHASLTPA